MVEHFTKHVSVYPEFSYRLVSVFYYVWYFRRGLVNPGSDKMSERVQQLNEWLQEIKHVVTLVDRRVSNGAEGSNQLLLQRLKTLVHNERVVQKWSDRTILCLVTFALSFDAKFGSEDEPYLTLPN